MLTLRLIRHPKPVVAPGVCYGATDLQPDAEDLQAQLIRCKAMPKPRLLLSSPLQRCSAVALGLAAHGWPTPVFDAKFAEMSFGEWEMRSWRAIERAQLDQWAANIAGYVPPAGESLQQVAARVKAGLELHLQSVPSTFDAPANERAPDVVLICHSGVMQALSHALGGDDWASFKPRDLSYGEVMDLVW
jgi:alpha-ribazole phosphatase